MKDRRIPIVAVFGSDEKNTLDPAYALGVAIAERGCILLTGGGAPKDSSEYRADTVKEKAIRGFQDARAGSHLEPWIGLPKSVTETKRSDSARPILLGLRYGDKRNYVEAHLCDVAIALQGGEGTKSEVAFCLALRRPVLLLGSAWKSEYPLTRRDKELDAFLRAARARVDWVAPPPGSRPDDDDIDQRIRRAYGELTTEGEPPSHMELPRKAEASTIVEFAVKLAQTDGYRGSFPRLPDRPGVREVYDDWLRGAVERLMAPAN
jgi:hypothetical protein